jgi:hypothetical protein
MHRDAVTILGMEKNHTIGPVRVDGAMKAGLARMARASGEDVTVADVVRAAVRDYLASRLPPEGGGRAWRPAAPPAA